MGWNRFLFPVRGMRIDVKDRSCLEAGFDDAFYRAQLTDSVDDPLSHYLRIGWKQGLDPAPSFSTRLYLKHHQDVARAGVNPFQHFITKGQQENRQAFVSRRSETAAQTDTRQACVAAEFDADFYMAMNPDVAAQKLDPVRHFMTDGWREGRDPRADFSTQYYLDNNPDIAASGVNPFWHYIVAGRAEGRAPFHPAGYKADILRALVPLDTLANAWSEGVEKGRKADLAHVRKRLGASLARTNGKAVVGIGHDNYKAVTGGTQLAQEIEEEEARKAGYCYISLHPTMPRPNLADPARPDLNLLVNGQSMGILSATSVVELFDDLSIARPHVVVHSLLGHAPESIVKIVQALQQKDIWFWLHDYFSLCPGYTLQRNDVAFCGAPNMTSVACGVCVYGGERKSHVERISVLFKALNVHIISPSEAALEIWQRGSDLAPASETVLPHLTLEMGEGAPDGETVMDGPVRVAFLGAPAPHKGWHHFLKLATDFAGNPNYVFHYFGQETNLPKSIHITPVSVTAGDQNAMTEAVQRVGVDYMIHWSAWPETFSYTTFEALAAGCDVLTSTVSGNVASAVRRAEQGQVFATPADLNAFFETGAALTNCQKLRKRRRHQKMHVTRSRKTIDLIEGRAT